MAAAVEMGQSWARTGRSEARNQELLSGLHVGAGPKDFLSSAPAVPGTLARSWRELD